MARNLNVETFLSRNFGAFALAAWEQLVPIEEATKAQSYPFMEMDTFNELMRRQPIEGQAIYWQEMLHRIHLATISALSRHGEWLRSLFLARESECLFGAYASYRGFLESAADSFYSLGHVPKAIAPQLLAIERRVKRTPSGEVLIAPELEERLIHFTHGRKATKSQRLDPAHAAKQIRDYLEELRLAGAKDVHLLYSELCEMTHPSAETVVIWYSGQKVADNIVWQRRQFSASASIDEFLSQWKAMSEVVMNAAFVPLLQNLRILHRFSFYPKIPSLKRFPFSNFPNWDQIERYINK